MRPIRSYTAHHLRNLTPSVRLQVDDDGESYWVFESRDVRVLPPRIYLHHLTIALCTISTRSRLAPRIPSTRSEFGSALALPSRETPTPQLTDRFLPGHTRAAQDVLGQCVPQLSTRAATVVLTLRIPPALDRKSVV